MKGMIILIQLIADVHFLNKDGTLSQGKAMSIGCLNI